MSKELMNEKDERMKIITETFNTLKFLKLYGWEDEFLKRIDKVRNSELEMLKMHEICDPMLNTLFYFSPVAISIISIGAYQYFND